MVILTVDEVHMVGINCIESTRITYVSIVEGTRDKSTVYFESDSALRIEKEAEEFEVHIEGIGEDKLKVEMDRLFGCM